MFQDLDNNQGLINFVTKYFSFWRVIQLGLFVLGLVVSGVGLFQLFSNDIQAADQITNEESISQYCETDSQLGRIIVDIGGAVNKPGVYELETGSRMNDLVALAEGFSNSADKYHINKALNLSERLNDGEKFYIPTIEESIETISETSEVKANTSIGGVSINSATTDQLMDLEGIGEKRAEDIVSERPYDSLTQLLEKEVLTESVFEKIKNEITL